jgi:hypothetical protein
MAGAAFNLPKDYTLQFDEVWQHIISEQQAHIHAAAVNRLKDEVLLNAALGTTPLIPKVDLWWPPNGEAGSLGALGNRMVAEQNEAAAKANTAALMASVINLPAPEVLGVEIAKRRFSFV